MERVLTAEGPFRYDLAIRYLRTSPSAVAETIVEGVYHRAFLVDGLAAVLRVDGHSSGLRVVVDGPGVSPAALERAVAIASAAFGLAFDPRPVERLRERDDVARSLIERYAGLRPMTIPDPFEAVVWAILGQQINVRFAASLKRALIERYGTPVPLGERLFYVFPPPSRLAALSPEEMRPLQISASKARSIVGLARSIESGALDLERLRVAPDEHVIATMTQLWGIGRWTAEYLLMRGFGRPDAIPANDMGLRAALGRMHGLGRNATEAEVRAAAESWAPWRGVIAFYIWFALQQGEIVNLRSSA